MAGAAVRDLLGKKLVFVTGKGGTGKTSFAAALACTWADRGERTILCEVDAFRPSLTAVFGVEPVYEPRSVSDRLDICNLTWRHALEEWLEDTVPVQRIVRLILGNRIVQLFLDATPGVRETVMLSRIMTLVDKYDRVVVDLPASGHAVSMLRVPHIAVTLMRAGPIRERSEQVLTLYEHPTTAVVIAALPEEMVVNETVELFQNLHDRVPGLSVRMVALNKASLPTLTDDERSLLARLQNSVGDDAGRDDARELLLAGRWEAALEVATAEALSRLADEVGVPVIHFPRLGVLGGFEGGPDRVVRQMTQGLVRIELAEASR